MLSPSSTAQGPRNGHPSMGRMLRIIGHGASHQVPRQDYAADGLSTHDCQGAQVICRGWLDHLRHLLSQEGSPNKVLEWGQVDFSHYNEIFTGRARPVRRCTLCGSEHHAESDCPEATSSRLPLDIRGVKKHTKQPASSHLCQLFNAKYGNKCHFNPFRFGHRCMECRGSHPVSQCGRGAPPAKNE